MLPGALIENKEAVVLTPKLEPLGICRADGAQFEITGIGQWFPLCCLLSGQWLWVNRGFLRAVYSVASGCGSIHSSRILIYSWGGF